MTFEETLAKIEQQGKELVWWKPEQIARGEDVINDPKKGERSWSVPRTTGEFLSELISKEQPKIILELGTSIGYSTAWLAHAAKAYGGHIYTIERGKHKYDIAKENFKETTFLDSVTFINDSINAVLENLDKVLNNKKIDFLFMDADRGHYHEYLKQLESSLSENCIIVADNAINMQDRMKPFLGELTEKGWKYEILEMDNGILVAHKK